MHPREILSTLLNKPVQKTFFMCFFSCKGTFENESDLGNVYEIYGRNEVKGRILVIYSFRERYKGKVRVFCPQWEGCKMRVQKCISIGLNLIKCKHHLYENDLTLICKLSNLRIRRHIILGV